MKNIKIISVAIFVVILLSSCGFAPLNQKNSEMIYVRNINIVGDQRVAYLLKNNIFFSSDASSVNRYDVEISVRKQKDNKIKDETGKVTRYNLSIFVKLELKKTDDSKKLTKTFTRSEDYDVGKVHSDTINNENSAVKNIINQLSEDINNFINLSIRTK